MSDILIKNMEMPNYCYECPLNNQENGRCNLGIYTEGCCVPKDCPLVEVKGVTVDNHIDAQELALGLYVNKTKIYLEKRDGHTD